MKTRLLSIITGASLLMLSATASALDVFPLQITNLTKSTFSVKVANQCFTAIEANDRMTISDEQMSDMCVMRACKVEIHKSENCSDKKIVSFNFVLENGSIAVTQLARAYSISSLGAGEVTITERK